MDASIVFGGGLDLTIVWSINWPAVMNKTNQQLKTTIYETIKHRREDGSGQEKTK